MHFPRPISFLFGEAKRPQTGRLFHLFRLSRVDRPVRSQGPLVILSEQGFRLCSCCVGFHVGEHSTGTVNGRLSLPVRPAPS